MNDTHLNDDSFRGSEDAWMVDYFVKENGAPRWVRSPFLTWYQVTDLLQSFPKRDDISISRLRVHKESHLDEPVDAEGKTIRPGNSDAIPSCTRREYLFGGVYEEIANEMRKGTLNRADLYGRA